MTREQVIWLAAICLIPLGTLIGMLVLNPAYTSELMEAPLLITAGVFSFYGLSLILALGTMVGITYSYPTSQQENRGPNSTRTTIAGIVIFLLFTGPISGFVILGPAMLQIAGMFGRM